MLNKAQKHCCGFPRALEQQPIALITGCSKNQDALQN
jgi:hypothetical protein